MKISRQQRDSCIIEGFVLNELYKKKSKELYKFAMTERSTIWLMDK